MALAAKGRDVSISANSPTRHLASWVRGQFDDDGALLQAELWLSSGVPWFDEAALDALRRAAPFGSVPGGLRGGFARTFRVVGKTGTEPEPPLLSDANMDLDDGPLNCVWSWIPGRAYNHRIAGCVELTFEVKENGRPGDISVIHAEPPSYYERTAIEEVRQWRYRKRGRAIQGRVRLVYGIHGFEAGECGLSPGMMDKFPLVTPARSTDLAVAPTADE